MTEQEIINRINELSKPAQERMNNAHYDPHLVYAEIMWMTQEEATELLELRLRLPSAGEQRLEAKARIAEKISKRKSKKAVDKG